MNNFKRKVEKLPVRFHRMQLVCIACGFVFFAAGKAASGDGVVEDGKIRRPDPGQGDAEYVLYVTGLSEEETPVTFTVGEREYDGGEAEAVFQKAWEETLLSVPGENTSLSEVRSDLPLPGWLDGYGLRLRWFSEDPELLDNYGKVQEESQEALTEAGKTIWLRAVVSSTTQEREYQLPVTVKPKIWTEEERRERDLSQAIAAADESQRTREWLTLPEEFEGMPLEYKDETEDPSVFFPVMGFAMAAVYGLKDRQEAQKEKKRRDRQLLLDYSEILSRIMVFPGAGMTVRGAWEKIVEDYEKRREEKRSGRRYAYEEMAKTSYQMAAGKAEGEAYEEFGRRCGLQPYMKFAGLLIQNRKEGMKNLNQVMQQEMKSAFEERKNLARRQGEEAGTKLLAPLFAMLGVVMVMVMVPAMLAFA